MNKFNTNLEAALAIAKAGGHIFPAEEDADPTHINPKTDKPVHKEPRTNGVKGYDLEGALKGGFYAATTDPDQIKKWWTANPDRLIGYWPYKCGLFGIDIDRDGKAAVKKVTRELKQTPLAEMPTHKRGRRHLLHRYEGEPRGNKEWTCGDTRHAAGYLIAWHPEMLLEALERLPYAEPLPPEAVDSWLKVDGQSKVAPGATLPADDSETWPEGTRDNAFNLAVYLAGVANDQAARAAACVKAKKSGLPEGVIKEKRERVWVEGRKAGEDKERREDHMRDALIAAAKDTWFYLDSEGGGWWGFEDGQWRRSNAGPERLAQDITRAFSVQKHKRSKESAVVLRARSHLVRHDPAFNTDPELLGLPDGYAANLKTGEVRKARPDDMLTRAAGVTPEEGEPTTFLNFLREVLPDDITRKWLLMMMGYALTGYTRERVFLFCYGEGMNGKSTLLDFTQHVFGGYARNCPSDLFLLRRVTPHREEWARLDGARLVVPMEIKTDVPWNEAELKTWAGGTDRVTAAHKYEASKDFLPQCLLVLFGNEQPDTTSVTPALADRLRMVPFNARFEGAGKDKELPEKLKAEAGKVLQLLIRYAGAYLADGMTQTPPDVVKASEEYLKQANPVARLVRQVVDWKAQGKETGKAIVNAVHAAAESEAIHKGRVPPKRIYKYLRTRPGVHSTTQDGAVAFMGVELKQVQGG